jgi:hypothetical protein
MNIHSIRENKFMTEKMSKDYSSILLFLFGADVDTIKKYLNVTMRDKNIHYYENNNLTIDDKKYDLNSLDKLKNTLR